MTKYATVATGRNIEKGKSVIVMLCSIYILSKCYYLYHLVYKENLKLQYLSDHQTNMKMKFNVVEVLMLSLITSDMSAYFWTKSNCDSDSQCPTIKRRECDGLVCIPFIVGEVKVTTVSTGKCNDFYNGYLCTILGGENLYNVYCRLWSKCRVDNKIVGGSSCTVKRCVECYEGRDCELTVGQANHGLSAWVSTSSGLSWWRENFVHF